MPKKLFALLIVALLFVPAFAELKGLDSPNAVNESTMVKIGESVVVTENSDIQTAVAVGGSVTIAGKVREDVVAVGGDVIILKSAMVGGNIVAVGGRVEKEPGSTVKGDITEVRFPGMALKSGWGIAVFGLLAFISFLVIAAVVVACFGNQVGVTSYYVERLPGHALLWGLLVTILIIPVGFMIALSLIGIPFLPLYMMLVAGAGLFGFVAVGQLIGKKILKAVRISNKPMIYEALTGLIVIGIVVLIPVLGCIVKAIFGLMGLGAVAMTRFGTRQG